METHAVILVANAETVKQDLLQLDNGQSIVDTVYADDSRNGAFLHLAEDTDGLDINNNKFLELQADSAAGDANAAEALALLDELNPLASDSNAMDDLGMQLINGPDNGLNMYIGPHRCGLFKTTNLMTLMQKNGYGNRKWYGLNVYSWSTTYMSADKAFYVKSKKDDGTYAVEIYQTASSVSSGDAAVIDPAVSDPAVSDPAVSDPAVSDPAVSDPAVSDPAVSDPAVSDPAVSDPVVSDVSDILLKRYPETGRTGLLTIKSQMQADRRIGETYFELLGITPAALTKSVLLHHS